ncbi:MAG TPA: hypothetical protein VFW47_18040 [Phenylobacterium sp.]|nr:hypothetical protein [Phenylobacterium sp.]
MSLDELDEVRGGLQTPTGVEFGFGAVVRTFVDGSLALQTRLTWTDNGPVEALEFGVPTADLAAKAASSGVVLQGDGELQGLLIPGDGGATAVAHSVSGAYIGQLVINNANNRDIRQSTEITLALPQFAQMQQAIAMQAVDLRLQTALGAALRDAIAR